MNPADFLSWAIDISFGIVMIAIALGFYRIAKGPSLADRVVSLDMMTISIMAFCGLYAIFAQSTAFLDVAIVVALIGFLATVALARYAEREEAQRRDKDQARETDQ
ncbi:monovalent cation/H+ antiporter complex subunit F [Palleronia sp. KMU-117]|uniref:monovalent cation/H+ antiporter complex subunit F n=1 Tax=Palleronia sp. KMU-117 TaxID=3434108 RepID=UPI003D739941